MVVTRLKAAAKPNFRHCALDDLRALRRKLRKGKFVLERETDPAVLELFTSALPSQEEGSSNAADEEQVPLAPTTTPPRSYVHYEYDGLDDLAGPGPSTMEVRAGLYQETFQLYDLLFSEAFMRSWERHNIWSDLVRSREVVGQDVSPVGDGESCVNDELLLVAQRQSLLDECALVAYEGPTDCEQQQVALDVFRQQKELADVFDEENPFAGMTSEETEQQLALLGQWM